MSNESLDVQTVLRERVTTPHPSLADRTSDERQLKALLRLLRRVVPGDRLRTMFYLNAVLKPRKLLRRGLTAFSRFDHVYDVITEFTRQFRGPFSILEFGTARGYAFAKLLYATRYLRVEDRVTVHAFDSFEGLPEATNVEDQGLLGNRWMKGAYRGSFDELRSYCESKGYRNFRLHKGYFEDSLTDDVLSQLHEHPPILVWFDCDLYTSTRVALTRIMPFLRNGCVFYFDDLEFNFSSRFTGQARLIHEINRGQLGEDIELVPDRDLAWDSNRIYRFLRVGDDALAYHRLYHRETPPLARPIGDCSPFP